MDLLWFRWVWRAMERDMSTPGPKYCSRCGATNRPDASYCVGCGMQLPY
jgi:ribosomal protein L40E